MSFSEKTWQTGDVITADLLNRLEQALASHDGNITSLLSNLGDLTQLSTSSKGNLVAALNEVKGIIPVGGTGGSGSLVYNTLTDLQNAYPSGTTQPAWVIADNSWYYWVTPPADTTPPTISISPVAGLYNANQSITLLSNETATIYYTLDGSTPNTSSSVYSSPISVSATTTIKYFGKDTAGNSSNVQSATYTIDTVAPVITASSSGGTFTSAQTVTLSSNETATIYYTLDGSTPTTASTVYSSALTISSTSTLNFFGKDTAGNSSAVQSISFTINAPDTTPPIITASPSAGTYTSAQSVTLSSNETATIYYTTDGTTPTTSSNVYSSPISISATTTLQFIGKDASGNVSTPVAATYTINPNTSHVVLNGSSSYITIPASTIFDVSNNFKMIMTFAPADLNQTNKYLLNHNDAYSILWEYTNNSVEFYSGSGKFTGSDPRTGSAIVLNDTNKHTITYEYDGTTWKGSLDGTQVFSVARTFTITNPNTTPIILGNSQAAASADAFSGSLYDFSIYKNGVLVGQWNFNQGSGTSVTDSSGNGNTATLVNTTWA